MSNLKVFLWNWVEVFSINLTTPYFVLSEDNKKSHIAISLSLHLQSRMFYMQQYYPVYKTQPMF